MTNKEALIAVLMVEVPDNSAEKALIDEDIIGEDEYDSSMSEEIDFCAIELLKGLLSSADVSEGGYSTRLDRKAIETRLSFLFGKYGMENTLKPSIRDATSIW